MPAPAGAERRHRGQSEAGAQLPPSIRLVPVTCHASSISWLSGPSHGRYSPTPQTPGGMGWVQGGGGADGGPLVSGLRIGPNAQQPPRRSSGACSASEQHCPDQALWGNGCNTRARIKGDGPLGQGSGFRRAHGIPGTRSTHVRRADEQVWVGGPAVRRANERGRAVLHRARGRPLGLRRRHERRPTRDRVLGRGEGVLRHSERERVEHAASRSAQRRR